MTEGRSPTALLSSLRSGDTMRAAGMGFAAMAANVVTLVFTVVFARVLGPDGYGELGAMVSAFLILVIPGSALQISVARELSVRPGRGTELAVRGAIHRIALATVPILVLSVLLREPAADALNVDTEWAAGSIVPSAWLWLLVCVQRGALQGLGSYRPLAVSLVGEALGRLGFGLILYAAGLDVTGVFLGIAASLLVTALILEVLLDSRLGSGETGRAGAAFGALVAATWAPMVALSLIALMQNVDLIVVKHQASSHAAGVYASASLSAKTIVWIAVGLGYYLLPEAARRWSEGIDTRRLLARMLLLLAAAGTLMIGLYALAGGELLEIVFGADYRGGATFMVWLAVAMTLLAFTYLSVQHLLARERALFIWLLLVAAAAEPPLLLSFGADLLSVATALAALQFVLAAAVLTIDFRTAGKPQPAAT